MLGGPFDSGLNSLRRHHYRSFHRAVKVFDGTLMIENRESRQVATVHRLSFVFSVCRLVSRRCHIISAFHQFLPAPRRTVRAQLTHTAPQTVIRGPIAPRCGAVSWPPVPRLGVRPVFPYSARSSVASFPPAALPAFAGTTRRSDSLRLFCLPPFGRLSGILSVSLLFTALSCSAESSRRVSRVAV